MRYNTWVFAVIPIIAADDLFNYRETDGNDYGPEDWDKVGCPDLETCDGWPEKYLGSIGWKPTTNQCEWCPITGNSCGQHRQSPIDLSRHPAVPGDPAEKECPDWHWISYIDGTCTWDDMDGQFEIERHALTLHTPLTSSGDIDCVGPDGDRKFPKCDYSKGFPDWWYLSETTISTPSEHVQHGQRYAAEVKLNHFYEIDMYKNKVGIVSFFLQDYPDEPSWPYLDKLICRWRREEEKKRAECGLPPAPVYKMCELYRGQTRTAEDLDEPTQGSYYPTIAPLLAPPAIPIVNNGADPDQSKFPLKICEGDCDFTTDCAPGLICFQRDALEEVPGCIGGEQDSTNTDYCVFDPFGTGYDIPTLDPTNAPTITARPTITPLNPIPLTDFGGTPPSLPLQLCQGDCDRDEDCAFGLICFQRTSYEAVPGCIGGETDVQKTDYCILDPHGPGYVIGAGPAPTAPPSLVVSPPTEAIRIQNLGWEPPVPLAECGGDCDTDEDCGTGMSCFQRNSPYQAVPGCLGGEEDPTLTDYCTFQPSESGGAVVLPPAALAPVATPVSQPTTSVPQTLPTISPVSQGTIPPQVIPTIAPVAATPTEAPFDTRLDNTTDGTSIAPPDVDCTAYKEVGIARLCEPSGCCTNPRSTTEYCHDSYAFLGDAAASVCHHCCLEENGVAMEIGPLPVANAAIPQLVQCEDVTQPNRICREGSSCCDSSGERTEFCTDVYAQYKPEEVESICWYCCYPSMAYSVGSSRRELGSSQVEDDLADASNTKELANNDTIPLREKDVLTYVNGRPVIVRAENFEEKGLMDEEAYFQELFSKYQQRTQRALQTTDVENYDNIPWWPYEWFLKVGTEYYVRYEGTMSVPPCFDTAHWRVFKDPIRVSAHQIQELSRLIAWRLGDNCEVDTAGKPTDSPDVVDVARPLQSTHKLHREVFCECKDWPSKFPMDREWCRKWQTNPAEERLFQHPYNWPSDGFSVLS